MSTNVNLKIDLDLDDEVYTEWGDNFSQIIKDCVAHEIKQAVQKGMRDKSIKERMTKLVMDKMNEKLLELGV